jgi:hypothetical protein
VIDTGKKYGRREWCALQESFNRKPYTGPGYSVPGFEPPKRARRPEAEPAPGDHVCVE